METEAITLSESLPHKKSTTMVCKESGDEIHISNISKESTCAKLHLQLLLGK